jgi:A/G-specific adenine glycosylase
VSRLADLLLPWFAEHGRHDLPWQRPATPYRVWVSEIMLQQTQVATVVPYFERFMARFPDVQALAAAPLDAVLAQWSGLGYYARARNLHRAAELIVTRHAGAWPAALEDWLALPGVGRSTAGAILSLAHGRRHAILDGNVKRVLVRYENLDVWPGTPAAQRELWALAEHHTPAAQVADYTQAIMDLGATVCTRTRARCGACPLNAECRAFARGRVADLPRPRPRRVRARRSAQAVLIREPQGRILLERRPAVGIWGGLFSLPELAAEETPAEWCRRTLEVEGASVQALDPIEHAFTHFDLRLAVHLIELDATPDTRVAEAERVWYDVRQPAAVGLAAPIRALLERMLRGSRQLIGAEHGTPAAAGRGSGGTDQRLVTGRQR